MARIENVESVTIRYRVGENAFITEEFSGKDVAMQKVETDTKKTLGKTRYYRLIINLGENNDAASRAE